MICLPGVLSLNLLLLAERADEGLHVDQVAGHQAFFKEAGAQVDVEPLHGQIGAPVGLGFVIDPPAQGFGRVLHGGGRYESGGEDDPDDDVCDGEHVCGDIGTSAGGAERDDE